MPDLAGFDQNDAVKVTVLEPQNPLRALEQLDGQWSKPS